MDRNSASKLCRQTLDSHGLHDWSVRLTMDPEHQFLGMCSYKDSAIILNAFHVDTHPEPEIVDTILHEVAHALVGPGHGHNSKWTTKAKEIGVNNLSACSTLYLDPRVIDAIRSGAKVEVTFTEETIQRQVTVEEKVFKPKYTVTRLQDRCPECGKVAIEKFAIEAMDRDGNQVKLITLECFHIIKRIIPKATPFESFISNGWKPEIQACKHDWDKITCKKCGENRLYNFQVIGARFSEIAVATQKGVGIFDDMGLGKTVQALALLNYHPELHPFMVVTKSNITYQWFAQIIRWMGPNYLAQIIKTGKDFFMPGLKCYVIPYDLLRRFSSEKREKLHALGIKCVVLDEVQQIKNPDSSRTQEVRKLVSANPDCKVIELSGTPWKNRGNEFFPALNLLDPTKFHSYQGFLDNHVEFYFDGAKKKMGGIRNPKRFREYIKDIVIRREYEEVMDEFPDVNRMRMPIQLDKLQQVAYDESISDFVKWYNDKVIGGEEDTVSSMEILAQLSRARHITGLAKIPATLGFLEDFIEETERKMVVFVHHKDVGQLMYNALINRDEKSNADWHELATTCVEQGIKIFKYTSELSDIERFDMQNAFNNSKRAIMIASTLACGEGVNLQTCADSIMHERQWNPANEEQATPGRFRRIGQLSKVINITVPEAEGTVDEDLGGIVEEKRRYYHNVMNKGEMIQWNESDIVRKLAEKIISRYQGKNTTKAKSILAEARK